MAHHAYSTNLSLPATKFGVSTFQLALVNSPEVNERCDNLEPGQDVCLGVDAYDCKKVYTVVKGDTCSWLETMYGMTQDTLHANNPQINPDCTNIYIGQVLCVDTQAFPYPEYNASAYNVGGGDIALTPDGRRGLPPVLRRAVVERVDSGDWCALYYWLLCPFCFTGTLGASCMSCEGGGRGVQHRG